MKFITARACLFKIILASVMFLPVLAPPFHAEAQEQGEGQESAAIAVKLGPSGLPIPRFVSLKSGTVNVRGGPDQILYPIAWIYTKRGLPVEIIAESDNWRRIRDADGNNGWVNQSLLSGRRTAMTAPWLKERHFSMHKRPDEAATLVAQVESGVIGTLRQCDGRWCEMEIKKYRGWFKQNELWGVYPGEKIK